MGAIAEHVRSQHSSNSFLLAAFPASVESIIWDRGGVGGNASPFPAQGFFRLDAEFWASFVSRFIVSLLTLVVGGQGVQPRHSFGKMRVANLPKSGMGASGSPDRFPDHPCFGMA